MTDLASQIVIERARVMRMGFDPGALWLVMHPDLFDHLRAINGHTGLSYVGRTDSAAEYTFCRSPIVVSRNVEGWQWLCSPTQRRASAPVGMEKAAAHE